MISTNITEILSALSEEEIKNFRPYINSPYFNKNKNVISFFEYLVKFYPEFNDKKLNKESVFRKLFPGKEYNDGLIRTLTFQLNNLLKDFIVFISDENSDLKKEIILLKEYNKRKLNKLFLKKFDELNSILDKMKFRNENYYYARIIMQREMEIYIEINRFMKKNYNSFKKNSLKSIGKDLSYYVYFTVISNYSLLFENEDEHLKNLSTELIDLILDQILKKGNKFHENPLLNLYQLQINILRYKKEEHYFELKELFVNSYENISHFDRYNMHNVLQHFCIDMIFKGKPEYRNERFELYKISLKQKLFSLYENDPFDDMLFGNIVLVAISVSEIDWLEKFIKDYSPFLLPEIRETLNKFSNAKVCFVKNNFSKALNVLNSIPPSNSQRKECTIRDLSMQCLYEMDMINELQYQFDSYDHFIRTNKDNITGQRIVRIKNFLKYFKKLVKLRENLNSKAHSELTFELSNNTNIIERNWLMNKLSEIKV